MILILNHNDMFQKQDDRSVDQGASTVIGPSVKVEGDFIAQDDIMVQGSLTGTLKTEKNLTVGSKAVINADIVANNAEISGQITGSLTIKGQLTLSATSQITGDVKTQTLSIESGAKINGNINMGSTGVSEKKSSSEK